MMRSPAIATVQTTTMLARSRFFLFPLLLALASNVRLLLFRSLTPNERKRRVQTAGDRRRATL